ncbi:MAG TPA: bifunctional transaldolase/phosoglucose isomerase [Anaerolineaceae bacterium]|jgi:transaldolase/glucose-6-phosphate isomerase|nr:bifunctional transaldolase/phosoglucose isomerase [Anaerolineaceae bacterium]HOQ68388.1 bifunctional transaldolase/phosoglucose isomerase [Anaerolineaceae bacterium]HPD63360.1 bifunctional transaldolase/phosoglucose isomerase [Anaerolineaceae bacterium]HRT92427.1 bifunctional transaldolase/phosoglucose isomerase [Anaerolineaceae bacterium]HUM63812.1 bifunctional transaldolase/phosoglucose isomerase [Anaerolineaceae bacterium]
MNIIKEIHKAGQSFWYDNIERAKLLDGSLAELIRKGAISGITSNPSIFQKAISTSFDYDITLKPMAWSGLDSEQIFWQMAIEDIQKAAQLFLPVYESSQGMDGYVSLEVNPLLAHDTEGTVKEARALSERVKTPNLMIKIPATKEGIPAIRQCTSEGLNINVTLIFSNDRYKEVMDAYLSGLEDRMRRGEPIGRVTSVASFFVSRIDTLIDKLLNEKLHNGEIKAQLYESLAGRAAIANARLAYRLFNEVFNSQRFLSLKANGARLQRPLWASTSTKNPAYRDVLYVEELIAPDTINTVPPATLDAFLEHGSVAVRIFDSANETDSLFERLNKLGISIDQVTEQLEIEGVKAFTEAYSSLLDAVDKRRLSAIKEISSLASPVKTSVGELKRINFVSRLYQKDPALWTAEPEGQAEARNRMNWLETPFSNQEKEPAYAGIGALLRAEGFTHAVLLGMGGSSLAPEVLSRIIAAEEQDPLKGLALSILDSTDPHQVKLIQEQNPALNTLYIVASKSGTTGEINALFDYFWNRTVLAGCKNPGAHFLAITDPDTKLDQLAKEKGFRAVYHADPQVGGRYSALTAFGLVPAAIMGLDLKRLNKSAMNIAQFCRPGQPIEANPGVVLGAILGTAAKPGKDKVTLITDNNWNAFGDWLEQLIAESSGKEGKGMVPVTAEPVMNVEDYSPDRLFVYLEKDHSQADFAALLKNAGHPVVTLQVTENDDLGGQFYLWEVAVATACSIIGVNAFDQPDVQDAKLRTLAGLAAYRETGSLPEMSPAARFTRASVSGFVQEKAEENEKLIDYIERMVSTCEKTIEYFAINAFLPKNRKNEQILQELRTRIGQRFQIGTTLGFGPRFLHSTGQLHKGGPNKGFFLVITAARQDDLEIPGQGVKFGVFQRAQAIGDLSALQAKDRCALWVDLDEPDPEILLME